MLLCFLIESNVLASFVDISCFFLRHLSEINISENENCSFLSHLWM